MLLWHSRLESRPINDKVGPIDVALRWTLVLKQGKRQGKPATYTPTFVMDCGQGLFEFPSHTTMVKDLKV